LEEEMRAISVKVMETEPETGLRSTPRELKISVKDNSPMSGQANSVWDWIPVCLYSLCMIAQMALTFLHYNSMGMDNVANLGWLVMTVSAVFGWLPIHAFKERGGVPEGKSYLHTTVLVDTGVYSVVRHPQYLAGVLLSLALALMSQYRWNAVLLVPVVAGTILDSERADMRLVDKFGEDYRLYKERVPALDPVTGSLRLLKGDKDELRKN
jgi:protein-S-isoprenylcysteine O-methyltransferase Ste14